MKTEKILMSEVATLYYKKNLTQQEIAETLHLTRQTVSKLLNDAIEEKIVEIIIHDPQKDCKELEEQIFLRQKLFHIILGYSIQNTI